MSHFPASLPQSQPNLLLDTMSTVCVKARSAWDPQQHSQASRLRRHRLGDLVGDWGRPHPQLASDVTAMPWDTASYKVSHTLECSIFSDDSQGFTLLDGKIVTLCAS